MNFLYRLARYPRIYFAITAVLTLLVMVGVAWQVNHQIEQESEVPLVKALENYAATLESGTVNSRAMGAAILFGLENQDAKLLVQEKLQPDASRVLSSLDALRTQYIADVVLLLNKRGVIVASSSNDHANGTGEDLSFRPCVQLAIEGTPNVYPAVGVISPGRGIYLAAPVRATMDSTSVPIGVVVIKVGADKLDTLLKTWTDGTAVLLSPQGVVFASGREDWLFHMIGKANPTRIAEVHRHNQFGNIFDQTEPLFLPFTLDKPEAFIEGGRYAVRSLPLEWNDPEGDWTVALLDRRVPWLAQRKLLGSAAFAGLVAALAFFWLYTMVRFRDEIQSSEERYRLLLRHSPVGIFHYDTNLVITYCNDRFADILKSTVERVIGLDMKTLNDQSVLPSLRSTLEGKISTYEGHYFSTLNPSSLWIAMNSAPSRDNFDNIVGGIAVVQDISERKLTEDALRESEIRFRTVIEQSPIGLAFSRNGCTVGVNVAYLQMFGFGESTEIIGHPLLEQIAPQCRDEMEQRISRRIQGEATESSYETIGLRKDGSQFPLYVTAKRVMLKDGPLTFGFLIDISERKKAEAELSRIAHYDSLTGVPNRLLLGDRMNQAIAQTAREKNMMAVCYLDLDGFKPINDSLGHKMGDEVLIEIAKRIGETIRGGDTVARLGGDEFAVLLLGLEKGEECLTTMERLLAAIAQPIVLKDKSLVVSASIGVSIYPLDDMNPDTLLRHADQAMYVAKQSGKNRFHIYDHEMDKRARGQGEFLKSISYGLENDQFELLYQPKICMRTKKMIGAEALIRWRHPERGLLSPAEFLNQIENTELDIQVGEWVTATALAQINHWQKSGLDIEVSINISGYHLESAGFVERLKQQLLKYPDMPVGKLQIEVLETVALNDISVVGDIIDSCHKIGVGFALDDFGTGYSSLSYLSKLPVDALKIDQSFIRDMMEDKGDMAIVQGIIAIARAFGRQTVAEGIETADHFQVLLDMGCEYGQGYFMARPMSASELPKWRMV